MAMADNVDKGEEAVSCTAHLIGTRPPKVTLVAHMRPVEDQKAQMTGIQGNPLEIKMSRDVAEALYEDLRRLLTTSE